MYARSRSICFAKLLSICRLFLPRLALQTGELLNDPIERWDQSQKPLVGTRVNKFKHMLQRVEEKDVHAMIEESKQTAPESRGSDRADQFIAMERLRRALAKNRSRRSAPSTISQKSTCESRRVIAAEDVPEAKKLIKLTLSLGGDTTKNVFAGIKEAYKPADLVGKLVVCVANLAPRKMKFGVSEGMVTAASTEGAPPSEVFVITAHDGAVPGQRVH